MKDKSIPTVSVIMGVYNTEEQMLRESIESILTQSFSDFEFLIALDNPTDNSSAIVHEYAQKDCRICVIDNPTNMGLTMNLIHLVEMAKGKYIARMDSDDISLNNRLKTQVDYLNKNEEVTVVSTWAEELLDGKRGKVIKSQLTSNQERNRVRMLFYNAGPIHPTIMMRKEFLQLHGINYDSKMKKSQDYGLWIDVLNAGGTIVELHQVLLKYRIHSGQITNRQADSQIECLKYAMKKQLNRVGVEPDINQLDLHYSLYKFQGEYNYQLYDQYIDAIIKANSMTHFYDQDELLSEIKKIWRHDIAKAAIKQKDFSFLKSKVLYK